MIDGINLQAIVILGAVFLGVVKLIVIVAQMHSSIKVLEDKIKALFELHNKAVEEQNAEDYCLLLELHPLPFS